MRTGVIMTTKELKEDKMHTKPWTKAMTAIGLMLLLVASLLLGACASDEPATEATTPTIPPEQVVAESEVVKDAVVAYLTDRAGNMKASDLFMRIADGDSPYIVSIRSTDNYTAGHIPGAVNISFGDLTTLPKTEEVLVYCYTGQSGSFAASLLGVLGYDVKNLLHGMASWSTDADVFVKRFNPAVHQGTYRVETTANAATGTYALPELDNTASTDTDEILQAAVGTVSPKYITASDLSMKIAEEEDMTIISVRSAEHYAVGHIPGAINIGLDNLADGLNKIDPDAPVYVYCYTGHSAAQAAALLNLLGYNAYSLTFGMCSCTADVTVNMDKCFDASGVQGYGVE